MHELSDGTRRDISVLERWMAQRLAELIDRTETEKDNILRETAAKECEDLVLKLWSKRKSWPSGGPLSSIMPTLNRLLGDNDLYYHNFFGKEPDTSGLIGKLIRIHEREMNLFLSNPNVAATKAVAEASAEMLDLFIDDLSEDERQVLDFVIMHGQDESPHLEDHELHEIIYKSKDNFKRLTKERNDLLDQVWGNDSPNDQDTN